MSRKLRAGERQRVVVLGGGFGGAYAAQRLNRLRGKGLDVTLLDRNNYMLFYPLLVEAGVGALEPRHVVVPLRRFMPGADMRMAEILGVDLQQQTVEFHVYGRDLPETIHYDHLVIALGSVTRVPPIPGLHDHGFELKTLADAVELRDRGIRLLETANTIKDRDRRRDVLRHVVIGANFTGVEFAGEYHAFLTSLARDYPNVDPEDIEMILLEYADRILPAVRTDLSDWAAETLRDRGVDIRTGTSVTEVGAHHAVLTTGERLVTSTVLWAAGIQPNPLIAGIDGLPLNERGYIRTLRDLKVEGFGNVWAIGDGAAVFTAQGAPYAATAQTASRQGPLVADNILRTIQGEATETFDFTPLGAFAAIGHRRAAADVMGKSIKNFWGWFFYRAAYLTKLPTFAMKLRVALDWTLELFLPSDPVQLGVHQAGRRVEVAKDRDVTLL